MSYNEYLKLLGLNFNFTEDELKKAYRKKALEWHPDYFETKTEEEKKQAKERMQEINEAYEYLSKNIGTYSKTNSHTTSNSSANNFDVREYAKKKYDSLQSILNLNIAFNYDFPNCVRSAYYSIKHILDEAMIKFTLDSYSKEAIDRWYSDFKSRIKDVYIGLRKDYFKEYFIDEKYSANVNYNCNFKEFYDELKKIKNKYSKKVLLEKKLETEILKYEQYSNYDILKRLIHAIKEKTIEVIVKNNFESEEDSIKALHREIEDLFKRHFRIVERLEIIKKYFETKYAKSDSLLEILVALHGYDQASSLTGLTVDEIKIYLKIKKYKIDYDMYSMDAIESELDYWDSLIIKDQELEARKNKLAENKAIVNELYAKITNKANQILLSFDVPQDIENISSVYKTMQAILELFKKYSMGLIDIDKIKPLEQITFLDYVSDNNIINSVDKNVNVFDECNIYLKKPKACTSSNDHKSFFLLSEENGKYHIIKFNPTGFITDEYITFEELQKDYISLNEVLLNGNLMVSKVKWYIDVFYKSTLDSGDYCVYLEPTISIEGHARNVFYFNYINILDCKDEETIAKYAKYTDKEYVKKLILEHLQERLRNLTSSNGDSMKR